MPLSTVTLCAALYYHENCLVSHCCSSRYNGTLYIPHDGARLDLCILISLIGIFLLLSAFLQVLEWEHDTSIKHHFSWFLFLCISVSRLAIHCILIPNTHLHHFIQLLHMHLHMYCATNTYSTMNGPTL